MKLLAIQLRILSKYYYQAYMQNWKAKSQSILGSYYKNILLSRKLASPQVMGVLNSGTMLRE